MVILRTLLVCLIIALRLWGIYAALRSILSNKWLHDETRQDVIHLFNQDLPKWLEAAYTALNQHLQTQCSKCDWSIEITCPSHAVIDRCRINFPVRKVLFWTVPISNYSIIKQRIYRNYMPFNAQMPIRWKHLSVFLSPTPIFSRHSLLLQCTPIRR